MLDIILEKIRKVFFLIFMILGYGVTVLSPFGVLATGIIGLAFKGFHIVFLLCVCLFPLGCLLGLPFIYIWYIIAFKIRW